MVASSDCKSILLQVVSVDRKIDGGFSKVVVLVEGLEKFTGCHVEVQAKNENYVAERVDPSSSASGSRQLLACTPDLISIVDSDRGI